MTPTFVDAGVLIAAACGVPEISEHAIELLDDSERTFATSDLVRLEVIPKPRYHGFDDQVDFYEEFFASARRVPISKNLLEEAFRVAWLGEGSDQLRNGPSTCYGRGHSARENREPALGFVI